MSIGGGPPIDVTGVTLASRSSRAARAGGGAEVGGLEGADPTLAPDGTAGAARHGDLAELEPGAVIARYRIVGRLGAGGMGVVYRAHDTQLDREVALKLLRVGEDGTEGRTRMLREAKAAAKIRHPNVVTVYDAGEVFGRVFIAMELIDGVTLKAHFRKRTRAWREVVEVMLGAGEGLAAAHAAGLVHRDFKPDNVLVEVGGRVRVLDFGLARPVTDVDAATLRAPAPGVADGPPVQRTLTQTGMLVGTPAYMAPEQHLARGVDARSDQFAYCVTLYECLYGERPFAGDTQAELTLNVIEGRLLPPRDRGEAPPEIFAALQRGLAVLPGDRWPTLDLLLARLRAIARAHEPRDRRSPWIAAGLLVPLLGTAVVLGLSSRTGPTEAVPPPAIADAVAEPEEEAAAPRGLTGPGGAISLAPARPGLDVGPLRPDTALEVARVIDGILPDGTDADVGPAGLRLIGPAAAAWRDAATGLLAELDLDRGRRTDPLLAQVRTPAGPCGLYALGEDAAARRDAIAGVEGVATVSVSEALRVALVIGPREAQDAVARLLREARAPKPPRLWCFTNTNLQDEETCHPTREVCEEDARGWLGPKARCHGKK